MRTYSLLLLAATIPATAAITAPPPIPDGPVTYSSVSYEAPAAAPSPASTTADIPAPAGMETTAPAATTMEPAPATPAPAAPMPAAPMAAPSSTLNGHLGLNLYTSNYQVRGMGVTNDFSGHGWSSVDASYTFPNRNLFNRGLHHRISGTLGQIWDAGDHLADTPVFGLNWGIGKEVFPNLTTELGYSMHRGGLEGAMAKWTGKAPHRFAQDFNLTLDFNDQQRGFFGHFTWGYGFYGLTGHYMDIEAGYRLTDVAARGNIGVDLELSGGISPSFGYWGGGVEGIDAYRIRAAVAPYSKVGSFGRDAKIYAKPWIQASWAGSNSDKIDRRLKSGIVDHFQLTVGVEGGFNF
ncbi:MAG: hypothetical protein Q4F30_03815 [Akkermansia sp.]|nr:hypothetical protein [Akkermansia sp.]